MAFMSFFLILWLALLSLRLIQLQIIDHPRLRKKVIEQNQNRNYIIPKRGTIYDRKGRIFAQSIPSDSVFYTSFPDESLTTQFDRISRLNEILNLSPGELEKIKKRIEKEESFIWIKRKITPSEAESVKRLHLPGVHLKKENRRLYPKGELAAHILGGVGIDENGLSGVEYKYDTKLKGKKGECIILRDAKKREYRIEILRQPLPGNDLFLTIDETVQYIAEKELLRAISETKASWGTVIISQPSSGEILALANYPTYNPNHYSSTPPQKRINRAIQYNFEPGSTFKIVTASAALEGKCVSLEDNFNCNQGAIVVAGKTIKDHKSFSILPFHQVIQYSSNVGAIRVGLRIPKNYFFHMINSFGFGQRTGIDLPGEEKGIFRPLSRWSDISQASISFGQEISVTAIQLLQALNVIANKGILASPKIVNKLYISPHELRAKPSHYRRVISKETAALMTQIMEMVVLQGTGKAARIHGYRVAGKTGTAQKFDPQLNAYSSTLHTASFVGFVPLEEPAFSIVVVLDEPQGAYYGGEVAAPLFRRIAEKLLIYFKIPPEKETSKPLLTAHLKRKAGDET